MMYKSSVEKILDCNLDFTLFKDKKILITGGTGLIGTVLVDMFCVLNEKYQLNLKLILVSRNKKKFDEKFLKYSNVFFIENDVTKAYEYNEKFDYIINLAANTHPEAYAKYPVETITTNFLGTLNLLEVCRKNPTCRFLNLSSVEVYGENQTERLKFKETDCGFIDCNTVRSGYNESKRVCESLCQSYNAEYGVDFVTARLCRSYGPTLQKDDTKALSQFIFKGIKKEDIVLKSKGEQYFSYLDVFDSCTALITIMLKGKSCECYNIADEKSDIRLKDLAKIVADLSGTKVVFDLPSEVESKGFSKASVALLDSTKLKNLGWKSFYGIEEGLKISIEILKRSLNA